MVRASSRAQRLAWSSHRGVTDSRTFRLIRDESCPLQEQLPHPSTLISSSSFRVSAALETGSPRFTTVDPCSLVHGTARALVARSEVGMHDVEQVLDLEPWRNGEEAMQNGLLIGAVGISADARPCRPPGPPTGPRGTGRGWWCARLPADGRRGSGEGEFQWGGTLTAGDLTRPLEHVSFAGESIPLRHARPVGLRRQDRRGIDGRISLGVDHGVAGAEPGYGGPILDDLQAPAAEPVLMFASLTNLQDRAMAITKRSTEAARP